MKTLLAAIIFACIASTSSANEDGDAPRWFFLGEDEDLKRTFIEAKQVILLCIYTTDLEDIRPPFARVIHRATVVRSLKGNLKVGDKIEVSFSTDSLPATEADRETFIKRAHDSAQGDLRFAFLFGGEMPRFDTEFLFVPDYSIEMAEFLDSLNEPKKMENKAEMATPRKPSD